MGSHKTWSMPYRTWQLVIMYSETQKKGTEALRVREIYLCAQEVKAKGESRVTSLPRGTLTYYALSMYQAPY